MKLVILWIASVCFAIELCAQTFPSDFSREQVGATIANPTVIAFAPDGRIFVAQQSGTLLVIKNDVQLATPFLTLSVTSNGERGLIGIAIDPDFANNNFIYLYYTVNTTPLKNRISRFTANGDVALAGSEVVILELDNLSSASNHNGGALAFGQDGKLYVAVGDNANTTFPQNLDTYHGKILRINKDGSAPPDNPFFSRTSEQGKRIWAYGLRNPYTFSIQPGTGKILVNDVGQNAWEEINDASVGGRNFGWPTTEGPTTNPLFTSPLFAYNHNTGTPTGCAITGGTYFNPANTNYPNTYVGKFFFQDYCSNWIYFIDPTLATPTATVFGTNVGGTSLSLMTGTDGNFYYLSRAAQRLFRIKYTPPTIAPSIVQQPTSLTVSVGQPTTFAVTASGNPPPSYQWQKNGGNISNAIQSTYTISSAQLSDTGNYSVVVSNSVGNVTSGSALLTVNSPPIIVNQPVSVSTTVGQPATFFVTATGSGLLTYQWQKGGVDISGANQASFTIASAQLTDAGNYRVAVISSFGSITSSNAVLAVNEPTIAPTILTPPVSVSINVGQAVSFSVSASGASPLLYQWQKDGINISGATQAVFSIQSALPLDAGDYRVVVSNSFGNIASAVAQLTVRILPTILNQPASATVGIGQTINFSVTVSGTSPLSYQWQRDGIDIGGATQAMLTITTVQPTDAGNYRVVVTNAAGSVISTNASLTIIVPPAILVQPVSVSVNVGQPVSFSVTASGTAPLSYQWQKNEGNISNAIQSTYTISSAQLSDAGNYLVAVSNTAGNITSSSVSLTLTPPNQKPSATVLTPVENMLYTAGTSISFSGQGTDPEQGDLPPSAFSWQINFHHDTHSHDEPALTGIKQGTYSVPNQGETSDNVWYRIILAVKDSQGLEGKDSVDVFPRKSTFTFNTIPPDLQLTLDGQPFTAPSVVRSVQGILRTIGVVSPKRIGNQEYEFSSWSNGGPAQQTIPTPSTNVTLTATFSLILAVENSPDSAVSFPNPANDWLFVTQDDVSAVTLHDVVGKKWTVLSERRDQQTAFYVGSLPAGLYVLKINDSTPIQKIIIQR